MQAGFRTDQVRIEGRYSDYSRISDEADRKEHILHGLECGSQVFYTEPTEPDFVVVSVGSFADPSFPADGVRLRLTTASVDRSARVDAPARAGVVGPRTTAVRGRQVRGGGGQGPGADRGTSRPAIPSTTSPVARASRAELPTLSSTFVRRSRCGRTAGGWRETTRTSTRSATCPHRRAVQSLGAPYSGARA